MEVKAGKVSTWFGQTGGGVQYSLVKEDVTTY
ncbi:glycohydrolase toxin TNT-related protein [Paenibacillus ihumii]